MNFTEFDYLSLRNEIDNKCDEIFQSFVDCFNKYPNHRSDYYFLYQGKITDISICLSALDISENYYDELYKLVKSYECKIDKIYLGDVEK